MRRFKAPICMAMPGPFLNNHVMTWAYTTDVAGLIIHRQLKNWKGEPHHYYWNISHFPIGLAVMQNLPTRKLGIEIVARYLSRHEWICMSLREWENKITDQTKREMKDSINEAKKVYNLG